MNAPSLPRVSPLDREAIAKIEVGETTVSPAVARALVIFFLAATALVPMLELVGGQRASAPATAWQRLGQLPGRVAEGFREDATSGAPGRWNRIVAANRAALAEMAAFEDALEDESLLGRALRPRAQALLSGVLGAGNERVYLGSDGWLFFRPDLESVTSAGFLEEARLRRRIAAADEWTAPPQPDPRVAIVDFHRQLEARGIALIVVPTPVKPSVHAGYLSRALADLGEPVQNRSYDTWLADVRAAGVRVFDPGPLLAPAAAGAPQYLATDTHWRPEAMEAVAAGLAAAIRQLNELPALTTQDFRLAEQSIANTGDTAAMLDLPAGQTLYPPEQVWIRRVLATDGSAWRSSPDADVLLLGDSFTNIYSLESMGWGTSAGFAEHLSSALGRPLDRIVQNDAGAYATRELLARAGADRLAGKRVVIWQFAARELAFGDWKIVALR
jgi:hypothetical protein